MKKTINIVLAVIGSVGVGSGCTTSNDEVLRPSIDELKPGLNMIDVTDPTWGMTAAFVKDNRVVYLDQRVGALKPQAYRDEAPDEPSNEIDLRFVDGNGVTFFVQRGGDTYVDPTWSQDIQFALLNPAKAEDRIADFKLAQELSAAFATVAPGEFKDFRFTSLKFSERLPPSEDPEMIAKAQAAELNRPAEAQYADWNGGASWWFLEGDLYDKKTGCVLWSCFGRHSGVAMWAYQSSWGLAINACNHGSCPGWSGMTYRCYSTSGDWKYAPTLAGDTSTSTSIGGGCLTPYSWNSGGYDHLCNDDSAYELWQIKNGGAGDWSVSTSGNGYNFIYTGAGTGGDGSWVNYACNCNNNNGCNNDWSRPICP